MLITYDDYNIGGKDMLEIKGDNMKNDLKEKWLGKAYVGKIEYDVDGYVNEKTNDYIMVPKDKDVKSELTKSNEEIRNQVYEKLIEKLRKENIEIKETYTFDDSFKAVSDNSNQLIICKEKDSGDEIKNGLIKSISVNYKGKYYNMNFIRFYIDKDKKINCIFKNIQFNRAMKRYVNENGVCYPTTYRSQESRLDDLIRKNEGKNFCYNPSVSYDDSEKMAEEFVEFIKRCEKWKRKNTMEKIDWKEFKDYNMMLYVNTYNVKIKGVENNKIKKDEWKKIINNKSGFKVFDKDLGNFHLQPEREKLAKIYSQEINEKLETIKGCFNKTYPKESGWGNMKFEYVGARSAYKGLYYGYLHVDIGNRKYEIMGFRMAIKDAATESTGDGVVECRLKDVQFEALNKGSDTKSYEIYPSSLESGIYTSISSTNLGDVLRGNYYYNPDVDFYDETEKIVKAFIEFIKKDQINIIK